MSSTQFKIKVQEVSGTRAVLRVTVVSPDVDWEMTDNLGFALMLLSDDAPDDSPIASVVTYDETSDESWVEENARGFLKSVSHVDVSGRQGGLVADGDNLVCDYTLEVTHPAWLAHLVDNDVEWESAAYDIGNDFREHAPITPAE